MRYRSQHPAPVVLAGKPPHRRPQNIILTHTGIRQEPAPLQGVREAERTAPVDPENGGQMAQGYRFAGPADGLENQKPRSRL